MADELNFFAAELEKFHECSRKINRMVFRDTEELRNELNQRLDELNSIGYSSQFVKTDEASGLLCQICVLVPVKYEHLVTKVCHLVVNIVNKQQVNLDHRGLDITTEYLLQALKASQPCAQPDILRALGAVIYENVGKLERFHEPLLGVDGILLQLTAEADEDTQRTALQCVENMCLRTPNGAYLSEEHISKCYQLFSSMVKTPQPPCMGDVTYCRLLVSALRGIQNILVTTRTFPGKSLGELLAAVKVYMLHGLPGQPAAVPTCMFPTPVNQYSPSPPPPPPPKPATKHDDDVSLRPSSAKSATKSSVKKGKKKKNSKQRNKEMSDTAEDNASELDKLSIQDKQRSADSQVSSSDGAVHSSEGAVHPTGGTVDSFGGAHSSSLLAAPYNEIFSPYPVWSRISSSESEYSDTEGAQSSKLRSYNCRVRQCALGVFHALIKAVDRREMFGYWTSFIPDNASTTNSPQTQTLFTSILRDPSPKARTAALAVLTALLEGSKQYLAAADDSDQLRAFISYSVTLGSMIKELHRCLSQVLSAENSPLAVTQVIKCLATLVLNVPYQQLRPGLLTKVVKQIKPFLSHRDPNVRVACLTCLGSVVINQAPLLEVCHILQSSRLQLQKLSESGHGMTPQPQPITIQQNQPCDTFKQSNTSASDTLVENGKSKKEEQHPVPNIAVNCNIESGDNFSQSSSSTQSSSAVNSGTVTPTHTPDGMPTVSDVPWVVRLCVRNVAPHLFDQLDAGSAGRPSGGGYVEPLPVRLESLQLLASLSKGYFIGIRRCLVLVRDVIHSCLSDKDPSVQLHAAKLLEEAGRMLMYQLQEGNAKQQASQVLQVAEVVEFWTKLLQTPVPAVLQTTQHSAVRATTCDAIANIGYQAFENLPLDRRLVCITLLLGLTSDDDRHVRAAAVRSLGLYILYPCLREDVSFVADAGNAILNSLAEPTLSVRIKAAWSLGNLGDALVMNKESGDMNFTEDLSDMLLMKLFTMSTKACMDNDKVRSNAVRALGNLLRYINERSLGKSNFITAVEQSIQAVTKNISAGTMKVRWNACYAASNIFKNSLLPFGEAAWTEPLLGALASVVRDCKNFKVRINAAIALSVPQERHCFCSKLTFARIWENLLVSLEGSEEVSDFTEYKYRDNLREQVCSTLVTLAVKISRDDLLTLGEVLTEHGHSLITYMDACRTHLKAELLQQGVDHMTKLYTEDLSDAEVKVMQILMAMMTSRDQQTGDADIKEDTSKSPKTALNFEQSYK